MERSIEADFDEDVVSGPYADGLFLGKLKEAVFEAEREVVGDDTRGPEGENLVEVLGFQEGFVGVCGVSWFDGATVVMVRDVDVAKEDVGLFHGGDSGQTELFDQTVLVGTEVSFHATLGLRGVGADDLDVEVVHGACELCDGGIVPELLFDGGLAIDLVDGVFVDVEGDGSSPAAEVIVGSGHEVESVFNRDKATEEDFACSVVDKDQEGAAWSASLEPIVIRTIQLDQFTDGSPAFAPSAVFRGGSSGFVEAFFDHCFSKDKGREVNFFDFFEFFIGKGRTEVGVFGSDEVQRFVEDLLIQLVIGRLAAKAMNDAFGPFPADVVA